MTTLSPTVSKSYFTPVSSPSVAQDRFWGLMPVTRSGWATSSEYAESILASIGAHRALTDIASQANSLFAMIRSLWVSNKKEEAEKQIVRLEAMRGVASGWDGRQASAPNEDTIAKATALLRLFAENGIVIPTATMSPSGNAALFVYARGLYIDIEVKPEGQLDWLIQLPGGPEIEDAELFNEVKGGLRIIDILQHAPGSLG